MPMMQKAALLAAIRNAGPNPRAVELLVWQIEQGEFDGDDVVERAPKPPAKAEPELAVTPEGDLEFR
jgi:hypothetical protein